MPPSLAEAGAGVFINRQWLLGAEYRQKPDNLSFAHKDDWWDLSIAWVPDRRLAVTAAVVNLGDVATLKNQLCELSGGPCQYSRREMRESHAAMGITNTQFNALAENLILAMEENNVPTAAQNRLIKELLPM